MRRTEHSQKLQPTHLTFPRTSDPLGNTLSTVFHKQIFSGQKIQQILSATDLRYLHTRKDQSNPQGYHTEQLLHWAGQQYGEQEQTRTVLWHLCFLGHHLLSARSFVCTAQTEKINYEQPCSKVSQQFYQDDFEPSIILCLKNKYHSTSRVLILKTASFLICGKSG